MFFVEQCNRSCIDWRKKGCVTSIKDQGQCGSCWAFSAVGSIESAYCIKTGKLVSLSEQQLIDCSSKYGNMGCNGGLMDNAFEYLKDAGGSMSENSYPYQAASWPCKFNASGVIVKVCGFINLPSKDESALQQAVATIGPMSVAIDASHSSFQLYRRGGMYFHKNKYLSILNITLTIFSLQRTIVLTNPIGPWCCRSRLRSRFWQRLLACEKQVIVFRLF